MCFQRLSYGTCTQDYIRADILERSIIEELRNLSTRRDEIAVFLEGYRRSTAKKRKALEVKRAEIAEKLKETETEREGLFDWVLKNKSTEKSMRFLNQKVEDIDAKENALKTALWEVEDTLNEAETRELNVETITNYLAQFTGMYDNLEAGEKKLCVESLVKRVETGKNKEITLTLL